MNEDEVIETLRVLLDSEHKLTNEQLESIALQWTGYTLQEIIEEVSSQTNPERK